MKLIFVLVLALPLQLLNDQLVPILQGIFSPAVEVAG